MKTRRTARDSRRTVRSSGSRGTRWRWLGGVTAAAALTTAGCGAQLSLTTAPVDASRASVTSEVFGQKSVTLEDPAVIKVSDGRIESVVVRSTKDGKRIDGALADGGAAWQVDTSELEFGTKYKVVTRAVDLRGQEVVVKKSFRTFVPEKVLTLSTNVWDGSTYGVGMPITVSFNQPVKNKAAIEKRLLVRTDGDDPVVGAWSWGSDQTVTYRPKKYWPARTKVKLKADIKGVAAGDGVYATSNARRSFKIGAANIMKVDAGTHVMKYQRDGKVIRTMPVSTGKPGYDTYTGIKVLMTKERDVIFTADVPKSDPEYYKVPIDIAMRLTWSGEYIHSAPWSVADQGVRNVSHGCVNVSPDDAEWLIANSNVGDIVETVNAGSPVEPGDGITIWNESWQDWKSGSAL